MRITNLRREDGYWQAHVTIVGTTYAVDRRYGSWRLTPGPGDHGYRGLNPEVSATLQARVRKLERREGRNGLRSPV